jgi:hypothetical protein
MKERTMRPVLLLAGLALIGLTVLFGATEAHALCVPDLSRRPNESAADYAVALVDSLRWAKQGLTRSTIVATDDVHAMLYKIKTAGEDYRCPAQTVQGFAKSENPMIADAADLIVGTFGLIVSADEAIAEWLVRAVDDATAGRQREQGRAEERLVSLRIQRDEAWKLLPLAMGTGTYGFVLFTDSGQPTGRLRLTRAQRSELCAALEHTFGVSVRRGLQAGQMPIDLAAALAYQVLADPKWRSVDD